MSPSNVGQGRRAKRSATQVIERPRSSLGLILAILKEMRDNGPAGWGEVGRSVNLSHSRYAIYIDTLLSGGLLKEVEVAPTIDDERRDDNELRETRHARTYTLTDAGLDFVSRIERVEAYLAGFDLAL